MLCHAGRSIFTLAGADRSCTGNWTTTRLVAPLARNPEGFFGARRSTNARRFHFRLLKCEIQPDRKLHGNLCWPEGTPLAFLRKPSESFRSATILLRLATLMTTVRT
jgi:hypothetical protein